eukprot:743478-Hanusia_phi.AAC.1
MVLDPQGPSSVTHLANCRHRCVLWTQAHEGLAVSSRHPCGRCTSRAYAALGPRCLSIAPTAGRWATFTSLSGSHPMGWA